MLPTVGDRRREAGPARCTLHSVKGGVGRSTTAAVLARHLARSEERVLVVDLDIESSGLASAVLERRTQPDFGGVDWFVEELVGWDDLMIVNDLAGIGFMKQKPKVADGLHGFADDDVLDAIRCRRDGASGQGSRNRGHGGDGGSDTGGPSLPRRCEDPGSVHGYP